MFDTRWMFGGLALGVAVCFVVLQPMPVSDGVKEFIATPIIWTSMLGFGAYGMERKQRKCRERSRQVYERLREIHGDDVPEVMI